MKKIILRNPFVTKYDKAVGRCFIDTAKTLAEAADICIQDGDNVNASKFMARSAEHWGLAAKHLGFRNIMDMNAYFMRHGKF